MTTKEKIFVLLFILAVVIASIVFGGCSMFGNEAKSDATSNPESETLHEIANQMESIKKRVENIEKNYIVGGNLTEVRNEISNIKKEMTTVTSTVNKQLTEIQNKTETKTVNSTWFVIAVLGFVILKDAIRAWRESGSTLKNFLGFIT